MSLGGRRNTASAAIMTHTRHGVTPALQVLCWRSVCVLYTLIVCVLQPELANSAKSRCGVELISDLQFVCGDRGIYLGHPRAVRGAGPRRRGKGIVEQCCVKGCDLQHLEHYCAKPNRERRHTQNAPPTPRPEDQFWLMFLRRCEMNQIKNKPEKFRERLQERVQFQRKLSHASMLSRVISEKNPQNSLLKAKTRELRQMCFCPCLRGLAELINTTVKHLRKQAHKLQPGLYSQPVSR